MNNIKFAVESPLDVDTNSQWVIVIPMETGFVNPIVDSQFIIKFNVPHPSIPKKEFRNKIITDVYLDQSDDGRKGYVYASFISTGNPRSDFSSFYKKVFDKVGRGNLIVPGAESISLGSTSSEIARVSISALRDVINEYRSINVIMSCVDDATKRMVESISAE